MGTTGLSASLSSAFSSNMHPLLGAVLAGIGFWPKATRTQPQVPVKSKSMAASTPTLTPTLTLTATATDTAPNINPPGMLDQSVAPAVQTPVTSSTAKIQHTAPMTQLTRQPLRVVRLIEVGTPAANASQMAGRMVISGRMSDVCAELDRMAA
jgi:hypothetical protein